jgi:hypothetical protein
MDLKVTGSKTSAEKPYPAIDIIEFFKTRSALVVSAVTALDAINSALLGLGRRIEDQNDEGLDRAFAALEALVKSAGIDGDNLLFADAASAHEPFVICSVSRQASGGIEIRTIELDRDTLALSGAPVAGEARPLELLGTALARLTREPADAAREAATAAISALQAQVRLSTSRLSIIKSRLDLQRSFLSSVMEDEAGSLVRLDSHLNQEGARDMALEARRLLSGRALTIASGNRKTLASLFESHAAKEG